MIYSYLYLGIAALLPVIASVILYYINKKTYFGKLNFMVKQIIIGVIFGLIAVIGTEWGIPIDGAQVNCRDAAVITGGLLFGGPAGIIAGIIGGVERWVSVVWGVSAFSQVACTVSTILSGIVAAFVRKYLLENHKPHWLLSFIIGVVIEVIHLNMLIFTKLDDAARAMEIVKVCCFPMIIANGLSVMVSTIIISIIANHRIGFNEKKNAHISQIIQIYLIVCVIIACLLSTWFIFKVENGIATSQADNLLKLAISDVDLDVEDASNENMLKLAYKAKDSINKDNVKQFAKDNNIAEINIVNFDGTIVYSTNDDFIGYKMYSGQQSREFMCLLYGTESYVQEYRPISYDNKTMRKYAGVKTDFGFIQVGYDADQFQKDIASEVLKASKNRHVGETGYIMIADRNWNLISSIEEINGENLDCSGLYIDTSKMEALKRFEYTVNKVPSYCMYNYTEGYYIVSVIPQAEILNTRDSAMVINTFMQVIVFSVVFIIIFILIKFVVVDKMKKINSSLSKISDGNLEIVVDVRSNKEFSSLSDDINTTVDTLKQYIEDAKARIDSELEFAKNIQKSALPSASIIQSSYNEFNIYASMVTAKEVGGDFYDFYVTKDNKLHFLIADVSGKGIPAAMFMMRAKTELKNLTELGYSIDEVFTRANNALCSGNDAGMFVTAWQGGLDLESGLVTFANAGHNPPIVRHANGKFEFLKCKAGLVLAGMEGLKYKPQELQLSVGDTIYLYTDGVTEATNSQNELYGEERLLNILNSREFSDTAEICRVVKTDVDKFVGNADQFDDITMLALHYNGDQSKKISFDRASIEDIPAVTEFVERELEELGCPMKTIVQLNIAIDEIYSNISKFAYKNGEGPVKVVFRERPHPHAVQIKFMDEGVPYNPLTKSDPDVTLSAEEREIGGLGIYMVKNTMDDMRYKYENGHNVLTITKNI